MGVISKEIALQEVEKWLDYKKISESKKEARTESIDALVEAISDGYLVLNDDFSFVQTLKFPTENEMSFKQLTYKPRLKISTIHSHLQGVKASDGDSRICAYVAALTSLPKDLIKALDTEDYSIAQGIAIFFL